MPVRLLIPKLRVDAAVESAGQDQRGAMLAPAGADNVAWYKKNVRPGEVGNAVIGGHLDRADGSPAVFWEIDQLGPGDQLAVVDADGREHHFVVIGTAQFDTENVPIEEIFGYSLHRRLNLITCAGRWDGVEQAYSRRLVVYTQFIETLPRRQEN
jgi:sortase (surface protein transpeptidase)